jgi:hypothetical protein
VATRAKNQSDCRRAQKAPAFNMNAEAGCKFLNDLRHFGLDVPFLPKFGELIPLQPMLDEHEDPLPFILFAYAPVDRIGAEIITVRIARTIEAKRQRAIHCIPKYPFKSAPEIWASEA